MPPRLDGLRVVAHRAVPAPGVAVGKGVDLGRANTARGEFGAYPVPGDRERALISGVFHGAFPEIDAGMPLVLLNGAHSAEAVRTEVGDLAASLGITVHELHEKRASLEEAFMALTDQDVEYHGQESAR